jgi:hypothetical protein
MSRFELAWQDKSKTLERQDAKPTERTQRKACPDFPFWIFLCRLSFLGVPFWVSISGLFFASFALNRLKLLPSSFETDPVRHV